MPRCSHIALRVALPVAIGTLGTLSTLLSLPALAQSSSTDTADTSTATTAPADVRDFPQHALRGTLVVGVAPQASLNGQDDRLAPGARIRGADNLSLLPGQLSGQKLLVVYTRDTYRLIKDVWVLRPTEAALLWPETAQQAATWSYHPLTHRWAKPQ